MLISKRTRRSVAFLCLAAVALAVFLPGVAVMDYAVLPPDWVLLPELALLAWLPAAPAPAPLPRPLRSLVPPRAPPQTSCVA